MPDDAAGGLCNRRRPVQGDSGDHGPLGLKDQKTVRKQVRVRQGIGGAANSLFVLRDHSRSAEEHKKLSVSQEGPQ